MLLIFLLWRCSPTPAMTSSFMRFLVHTQRHIIVGRTPLDKWSARRRDLYLTTHNTQHKQTSMPPAGFEPTIPARERPWNHALDREATEMGMLLKYMAIIKREVIVALPWQHWPLIEDVMRIQETHCTCNVTLKLGPATIVAVEKQ